MEEKTPDPADTTRPAAAAQTRAPSPPSAALPKKTEPIVPLRLSTQQTPTVPLTPFERELQKALDMEQNTEFTEAMVLCRKLRSGTTDRAEADRLDEIICRLMDEKRNAMGLNFAIGNLVSSKPDVARAAEQQLSDAGEAGLLFLRKAVRDDVDKVAEKAVVVLAGLRDEKSLPLVAAWCRRHSASPVVPAIWGKLRSEVARIDRSEFPFLFLLILQDTKFAQRGLAGFFISAYKVVCQENKDEFNKLAGNPRAFDLMKGYIEKALQSDSPAVSEWAVATGAVFDTLLKGLRGSYYHGVNFDKLAFERLDSKIEVPERSFPYPDGRQDEISVRWTGFIAVNKPGKYTFYSASDDGQRLWVNDKQLVDDWNAHGVTEMQGVAHLQPGMHPFRMEFYQGSGSAAVVVSWSGPGFEKRVITSDSYRTRPWKKTDTK
jgi:hypothetical protein